MADTDWLGYTGAVTGVIGAITGIAGAIMGFISFRRSDETKALDLRLELKKAETVLRADSEEVIALIEYAKRSRQAVSAALGRTGSGAMKRWLSEYESDLAEGSALKAELIAPTGGYDSFTHAELEAKHVAVHALQTKVARLKQKYEAHIAADDRDRENIKADNRVRVQADLQANHERRT